MKRLTNMTYKRLSLTIVLALGLTACGGSSSEEPAPDPVPDPLAATLELPANNEVCYDGNVISESLSEVTFSWQPSEHTDRYLLEVTNLNSEAKTTYPAATNAIGVSLNRGIPYSWKVISEAEDTQATASSESWKFYLAGEGVTSYAPFPAELIGPVSGSTMAPAEVTFSWKGSDADSEALAYDLYLDTTDGKSQLEVSGLSQQDFSVENLQSGTVYFWSIVTTDPEGNTSRSPSVIFKTE